MTGQDILSHVDHTLLNPTATLEEVMHVCEEAELYHVASVCIPPVYVKAMHTSFPNLAIGTVVGFPLGYQTTAVKVAEAIDAIANGAKEIDMVVHIGNVKNKNYDAVTADIQAVSDAIREQGILKVIIETCYLTEDEIIELCKCVTKAGAQYIKTSTGFGSAGATLEHIELFKKYIGQDVKIKAAGGIRTIEDMKQYLELGVHRIGSSAAVKLLKDRLHENV